MRIRVIQGFAGYEPGQVFEDWPDGMCEILVARGVIERLQPEKPKAADIDTAEDASDVERAEMPPRRKRK